MHPAEIIPAVRPDIIDTVSRLNRHAAAVHIFLIHLCLFGKYKCRIRIFKRQIKYLFAEMVKMLMAREYIKVYVPVPLRHLSVKIVKQQHRRSLFPVQLYRE